MRAGFAAACLALLVGLSPPAAFACAWTTVATSAADCAASAQYTGAPKVASAVVPVAAAARQPSRPRVVASTPRAVTPSIWRTPSGPQPSQAPPAA